MLQKGVSHCPGLVFSIIFFNSNFETPNFNCILSPKTVSPPHKILIYEKICIRINNGRQSKYQKYRNKLCKFTQSHSACSPKSLDVNLLRFLSVLVIFISTSPHRSLFFDHWRARAVNHSLHAMIILWLGFGGHESGGSLHTCKIKSYRLGWNLATEKVRIFRGKILVLNFSQAEIIQLNI